MKLPADLAPPANTKMFTVFLYWILNGIVVLTTYLPPETEIKMSG